MRSLILAVLALLATAGAAHADGLAASAGGRYDQTTGLVAGRPAVIVSTLYLADSDCERPRDLKATLTPPRGIAVDGPRTLAPKARGGSRDDRMVNATWHVRAARAGVAWGRVKWSGTAADGTACAGSQHLRVVATSAPPTLSVVAAVSYTGGKTGVIVRASLPGVSTAVGEAFDTFFNEEHVLGRARRGLAHLLRPTPYVTHRFDADGLSCVLLDGERGSLAYRLRFTWNHAIGAASIVRGGSVPVQAAPRNDTERACERQYRPVPACDPCEGGDASRAGGLKASAGEPYGRTAPLVAGRAAVIKSTLFLDADDERCGERAVHRLRATFTAPPGVAVRGPRTVAPRVRIAGMMNATWHVRAAAPGTRWGRVTWRGTGAGGRRCSHSQRLRIVAASGPPGLVAVAAVRFRSDVGVILRGRLPGVERPDGETFDAFFEEWHVLGRPRRSTQRLLRPLGDGQRVRLALGFDYQGVTCVLVSSPPAATSVPYRLAFTWNRAIGAEPVRHAGSLRILPKPADYAEHRCEREFDPVVTPGEGSVARTGTPM